MRDRPTAAARAIAPVTSAACPTSPSRRVKTSAAAIQAVAYAACPLGNAPSQGEQHAGDGDDRRAGRERAKAADDLDDVHRGLRAHPVAQVEQLAVERRRVQVTRQDDHVEPEHVEPDGAGRYRGRQLETEPARGQTPPQEAELGHDRPRDRPEDTAVERSPHREERPDQRMALVGQDPGADLGPTPVGDHDPDDHADRDPEAEDGLTGEVGDLVERAPEDVPEHAERGRPQARSNDAERDEAPERHPGRAGDERRERAHEADEPADQDGLAAVAVEVALDRGKSLGSDLDPGAVALEEAAPEPAAEEEAG